VAQIFMGEQCYSTEVVKSNDKKCCLINLWLLDTSVCGKELSYGAV